jgi:nitrogen fixation NifU-like protein
VKVENGIVTDAAFQGSGCAISKASASLMTEAVRGKPVAEVEQMFEEFREMAGGRAGGQAGRLPSKLGVLSGVRRFPMRVKCATLAWHALHKALNEEGSS